MKIRKKMVLLLMMASLVGLGGCSFWQALKQAGEAIDDILSLHQILQALPPASALANFDATKATDNLTLSNASLAASSGTITITISDQSTGQLLGQDTFAYYINSTRQVHFSNPSQVTSWIRSFSSYPGYVTVKGDATLKVHTPPSGQMGSVASTSVYNGTPYGSSKITLDYRTTCPPSLPDCKQK